ncbi:CoA ester lyase [Burkholderia stagnalis]|nr:CoA ester lyase [Burkholderia stagnalis]
MMSSRQARDISACSYINAFDNHIGSIKLLKEFSMCESLPIRSILFTSAMHIDRFQRAVGSGTDVCLIDLEDSVSELDKIEARNRLYDFLDDDTHPGHPFAIRINGIDTNFGFDDLLAVKYCRHSPQYVVVPQSESASQLRFIQHALGPAAKSIRLIALIETPLGVQRAAEIALGLPRISALMFGSAKYTCRIGAEICWDALLLPRSILSSTAGQAGIGAIDAPFFDIQNLDGLYRDCMRVKQLGFTGRCAVHPSQIATVHDAFSRSTKGTQQACQVLATIEISGGDE